MTPKKNARVYLEDIRDAIDRIVQYTAEGKDVFLEDEKTQDAAIRQVSIIGEAARRLPSGVRARFATVPWRKVIGVRNILIHEYSTISIQRVWETIERDLPPLKHTIDEMLRDHKAPL